MAKVLINCETCDKEFEREKGEINRSRKLGRKIYCSSKCSGKGNAHHLGEHLGKGRPENLLQNNDLSRRDEYTEFKWFMRGIKRRRKQRQKEYDVDLLYLKQVWNEQKGICPLTGWKLELPKDSTNWKNEENKMYRSSLDRIDSNKGYIKGNVRYISVIANYCKNAFTDDEVILFCESVYKQNNIV